MTPEDFEYTPEQTEKIVNYLEPFNLSTELFEAAKGAVNDGIAEAENIPQKLQDVSIISIKNCAFRALEAYQDRNFEAKLFKTAEQVQKQVRDLETLLSTSSGEYIFNQADTFDFSLNGLEQGSITKVFQRLKDAASFRISRDETSKEINQTYKYGSHDPIRRDFLFSCLQKFMVETGTEPTATENGSASKFLYECWEPIKVFANNNLIGADEKRLGSIEPSQNSTVKIISAYKKLLNSHPEI